MPTYDYLCKEHGYFELRQPMALHKQANCPRCYKGCGQVLLKPPGLDYDRMGNDPDLPTAWERKGDRLTKKHRDAGQSHRPGKYGYEE